MLCDARSQMMATITNGNTPWDVAESRSALKYQSTFRVNARSRQAEYYQRMWLVGDIDWPRSQKYKSKIAFRTSSRCGSHFPLPFIALTSNYRHL